MPFIQQLAEQCVDEYTQSTAKHFAASGVSTAHAKQTLADVIRGLRAKGVPWASLLPVIGQILAMIFSGTPYGAIIQAILAILGGIVPPTPTPPTP